MTSDLAIFAARLRDFISICEADSAFAPGTMESAPAGVEFNSRALALFALQFRRNPAYRKFCEARRAFPDSVAHWSRIPAVPAAAFKDLELTSLPAGERATVFHSSGTTEQRPGRHLHSAESLAVYEASLWPWFRRHLLPDLTPDTSHLTLLAPPPAQAPHSSLVHMFATVWSSAFRRTARSESPEGGTANNPFMADIAADGGWMLDCERITLALRRSVEDQRPLVLLGTAFSFVHLLDHLAERDLCFELPPGSRVMETGGYKGRARALPKAELHALISARLAIPPSHIVCEYGMSEMSSQAYDSEVRGAKGDVRSGDRSSEFMRAISAKFRCRSAFPDSKSGKKSTVQSPKGFSKPRA